MAMAKARCLRSLHAVWVGTKLGCLYAQQLLFALLRMSLAARTGSPTWRHLRAWQAALGIA